MTGVRTQTGSLDADAKEDHVNAHREKALTSRGETQREKPALLTP